MSNMMLEAALAYNRMGWRIFPCHSIRESRCSCGRACNSPGKHPRTRGGFKDATDDADQVRRWWTRYPDANIALATGSGIAAFDIDGEQGASEFKALVATYGPPPQTLVSRTGNGYHLLFATQSSKGEVRSSAFGKVHVRGEGGYIILPPSIHASGRRYQWVNKAPLAPLPDWLRQWSQGYEITAKTARGTGLDHLGLLPAHLSKQNQLDVGQKLNQSLKTEWSLAEQFRLESALQTIPASDYQVWFSVGMALRTLEWERSDGTDIAFELWDAWSATCESKYSQAACESKWRSFGRRSGLTLGTVFHLAQQHGWTGLPAIALNGAAAGHSGPGMNGHDHGLNGHANGATALPAAFAAAQGQAIFFPDRTEEGKVKPTMLNAKVAIMALGIECKYDLFHNRMLVAGEAIAKWNSTELSDHVTTMLRDLIRAKFQFDPKKENTQDACETLCLARRFDPVLDYLDSLQWDGQPRLDRWMSTYLGAPDTELNRAIARLSLLAAVRRARQPGAKFDQIIVLEGRQGAGKSEAIRILAGTDNFSDQKILGVDDRKQQELTEGVWLYEIAELTGLRKTEIEHVKAFVSRTVDRARPAYGRYMVSQPRRTVFFGSTNPGQPYLQDDTGNRRFWPVAVSRIDLRALERDRDQLWAEAAFREASGESHILPESLWGVAAELQEERTETDEWMDAIANYVALKDLKEVSIMQVLVDNQYLQLSAGDVGQKEQNRAARILRGLNFTRYQRRADDGRRVWRYRRGD